jgi:quinolinate synthase
MKRRSPGSEFFMVPGMEEGGACMSCNTCGYMKMNTMEKLYACMHDRTPEIVLDAALMDRARAPLVRMLEMSQNLPANLMAKP